VAGLLIGGLRSQDFQATAVWLNGSLAAQFDFGGQVVAAVCFCVENGRITRIYGITNPRKLARLDSVAAVTRS
jgi:RNA polymerase sigma-70 factor (ECF subfamily)